MIPKEHHETFRNALLGGTYNLLFGSGVSLDSKNRAGAALLSAEDLRSKLCSLTGAKPLTNLARVSSVLTSQQIESELVRPYSGCRPGHSLKGLNSFLWRRLFTFNIDDVIENLYSEPSLQSLETINYDAPFEPTPFRGSLQAIHLHGFVRKSDSGFVFSNNEYARNMSTLNPWMHMLAQILGTEPFIIAGTSLDESDLEYYLSHRNAQTPRRGTGPSLLIEPSPDAITRKDCVRYGLTLVEATFGEFLHWLREEFPSPPSLTDLIVPDASTIFGDSLEPNDLLHFFSDFGLVSVADLPTPAVPSSFLLGREPEWDDLDKHYDIERHATSSIRELVSQSIRDMSRPRILLTAADAGTGKTTSIMRVGHDLALAGQPILTVKAQSRIDTKRAIICLSAASIPILLIVDNLADHAEQLRGILEGLPDTSKLVVLGSERSYRHDFVRVALGKIPYIKTSFTPMSPAECLELLGRYQQLGLIANADALSNPENFAGRLAGEPVAVSICRILNDFQPLDRIARSLWEAATEANQTAFLAAALSEHCYSGGVRYSLLQEILGVSRPIGPLFSKNTPLRLSSAIDAEEYVRPFQSVLGERVLRHCVSSTPSMVFEAFTGIASALASYVNRRAIIMRSPEARLAGRLFDADKVVKVFLPSLAEAFYEAAHTNWAWNTRYWEQRALFTAEADLLLGLQYARHAVAIEKHPYALTTLGKLLLLRMEAIPMERDQSFTQAMENLTQAINREASRGRITLHPFLTLFGGASRYIELNGTLSNSQRMLLQTYLLEAPYRFSDDTAILSASERLDNQLHNWT